MTKQDIRSLFSQKISELHAQGYEFYPDTMAGSQGEIAHVDLTNGSEIVRVLLTREFSHSEDFYGDTVTLRIGKATPDYRVHWECMIWNQKLEIRFEIKFAEITEDYYVDLKTAAEIQRKRRSRWEAKDYTQKRGTTREELGTAFKSTALHWLRKQPRMKSAKLEDIEKMERVIRPNGKRSFEIKARGKTFEIRT